MRGLRRARFLAVLVAVLLLLFGVPWWALVASPDWPAPVPVIGTVAFAAALACFPVLMLLGHGKRSVDRAARVSDTVLGVIWVLFAWSVLGFLLRIVLAMAGVADPNRTRTAALAVAVVAVVLLVWGLREAMRVPRVRRQEVVLDRLGSGLDGTTVVVITDTHYGPINRARWSAAMVAEVNALGADIVCHAGDIADGGVGERSAQVAPLRDVRARLAKVYVTGNHEYFGAAQGWLDHMAELGWQCLHNRHLVLLGGDDRLVLAGIDDATAAGAELAGHGADLQAALEGTDAAWPVLLVAHQPRQVVQAAAAGVDLQVSGHTHGGQIWPFHYLVRVDQPAVRGLSSYGDRTQLYISRGCGFWGPPFRIFAPSEISLITLRAADPSS